VLSRRLSSRAYFELVRSPHRSDRLGGHQARRYRRQTCRRRGVGPLPGRATRQISEADTAAAAIASARSIRDGGSRLGPPDVDVKVNVGVHWGATLRAGGDRGTTRVTALGDEMNEAARIESAAKGGPRWRRSCGRAAWSAELSRARPRARQHEVRDPGEPRRFERQSEAGCGTDLGDFRLTTRPCPRSAAHNAKVG
jgi:class 3 adenylate cyclase